MEREAIAGELVRIAKDLTAMQGSRVFMVEMIQKLDELKEVCSENATDYALLGKDGEDAVRAYRKIYSLLDNMQREISGIIRTVF